MIRSVPEWFLHVHAPKIATRSARRYRDEGSSRCPRFINIWGWRAKSETGLGFQFSGALSRLSACRWQFYGLLARAGLSRRRSLVATQCPLAPAAVGRRTASSYHISGYLGQRDEPCTFGLLCG